MSIINTNVASLNAQRNLSTSRSDLTTSIQRLSSGLRVNSAKDDAAGLSIATKMDSQIRGQNVAMRNANDGISMVQTAEGALNTISDALQRMRELTVQAANGSNGDDERLNLQSEFEQLQTEITRIKESTTFNGVQLLGSNAGSTTLQIGAGTGANDQLSVGFTDIGASSTSFASAVDSSTSISTSTGHSTVLTDIDNALKEINTIRSGFGAAQNRLNYAISNLQTSVENTSAAKSRIMDADFAQETAKLSRNQILQQAGTAMLAQANALPQGVLSLLRG